MRASARIVRRRPATMYVRQPNGKLVKVSDCVIWEEGIPFEYRRKIGGKNNRRKHKNRRNEEAASGRR